MFTSMNVPYALGMDFGVGVNVLNGQIAGKGVAPGDISEIPAAGGQTVLYDFTLCQSSEELTKSLGVSVEASGHYGLFSAEGKFGFCDSVKFNSQSTFLLAKCTVDNAFRQCTGAILPADGHASRLLAAGDPGFAGAYGDGFCRGFKTGGEFFACIEITSESMDHQTTIAASLQAKYGGLFADVQVKASLEDTTRDTTSSVKIHVATYQRGGTGDQAAFTDDVDAVMQRMKVFPAEVHANPVPYEVQIASYNTLELPKGPNAVDIQAQKDSLAEAARIRLQLLQFRSDVEFIQLHRDFFIDTPDATTLNTWQRTFTDEVNDLTRQASACVNNVQQCQVATLTLPDGFVQPQRKVPVLAAGEVIVWSDKGQGGISQVLDVGRYDAFKGQLLAGNDQISSVSVPSGMAIRLFEHYLFQGQVLDLHQDTADLGSSVDGWENKATSVEVYRLADGPTPTRTVVAYHKPFVDWLAFRVIGAGTAEPNPISDIYMALVPEGMVLRLYSQPGFQGDFIDILQDNYDIQPPLLAGAHSVMVYAATDGPPAM